MNSASKKGAFTLVELLVVISIILIATSVLFVASGGGGGGLKLSSAQRIVSTIAQGARGQALLKNTETRLIIYSDANTTADPDKILRYFGIVYWGVDADGTEGWLAATQGDYLPEGIYFNPNESNKSPWSKDANNMPLGYPRVKVSTGGESYYFYEFNANGTMASGFDNNWLVLQAGTLKPDGSNYAVDFDDEEKAKLRAALIFRRVGTTTMVTDPDFVIN